MVPADSARIPRVPAYSGAASVRLRVSPTGLSPAAAPLSRGFGYASSVHFSAVLQPRSVPKHRRFGLLRVRSPLLAQSLVYFLFLRVAVLTALGTWNDVMTPLVIMSGSGNNTLPLAQLNFQTQFGTNYNLAFASYLLALLPILIFYLVCQKQILNGVVNGALPHSPDNHHAPAGAD